ncbi:hypothetical protein [Dactylosporangium sp. CA-139066]|uniref:hypothetical protein n=1 Tax=Dactylosporangium sp. CA-139066 TaxID=3239930 RepID=UPI003D906DFA
MSKDQKRRRRYGVTPALIAAVNERRAAGDVAGACAAAGIEAGVDLAAVAHEAGAEVAAQVEDDLRHLVPDLLRWHVLRLQHHPARFDRRYSSAVYLSRHVTPLAEYGERALYLAPAAGAGPFSVRTASASGPSRFVLRFGEPPAPARPMSLAGLRELWDARHAAGLLARCGGHTRLPFFAADGTRHEGTGPEAVAERVWRLFDAGRPEEAWHEAGVDLDLDGSVRDWYDTIGDTGHPAAADGHGRHHAAGRAGQPAAAGGHGGHDAAGRAGHPAAAGHGQHYAAGRAGHPAATDGHGQHRTAGHAGQPAGTESQGWPDPVGGAGYPAAAQIPAAAWRAAVRAGVDAVWARGAPNQVLWLDRLDPSGAGRPRLRVLDAAHLREARAVELPLTEQWWPEDFRDLMSGWITPSDLHPLVAAALFPALPAAGVSGPPPMPPPPSPLVRCAGAWHRLRFDGGALTGPHSDAEIDRESAMLAMGGPEPTGCAGAVLGWRARGVRLPRALRDARRELMARVAAGEADTLEAMLDAGFDPRCRDGDGRTLLHLLSCLAPDGAALRLLPRLLAAGLDPRTPDAHGQTAIDIAERNAAAPALIAALHAYRAPLTPGATP